MFLNGLMNVARKAGIPGHIRGKFRTLEKGKMAELESRLKKDFFGSLEYSEGVTAESYLATEEGKADLENHASTRLNGFRSSIIPWLDSIRRLSSTRILEIGCGTGCSTVALAEQGAKVTGIDIDEAGLRVGNLRARLYGLDCVSHVENATGIDRFGKGAFDVIIFFATLEHMTIDERILSLKKAWDLLPQGGILVVIETPNRLWFRDEHTALLPFFHWLPDQLAFYYSSMSPRFNFYRFSNGPGSEIPISFHRLGRGASYHEFEIAIGKHAVEKVVSDLDSFNGGKWVNLPGKLKRRRSKETRFHELIRSFDPSVHPAFFHQDLNLAIRKD